MVSSLVPPTSPALALSVSYGAITYAGNTEDVQDSGVADYEQRARLSQFQGSQAISSSDYFGRDEGRGGGGGDPADFEVSAGELVSKLSVQVGSVCQLAKQRASCSRDLFVMPSCCYSKRR